MTGLSFDLTEEQEQLRQAPDGHYGEVAADRGRARRRVRHGGSADVAARRSG
jgi:hypothetical protein